ncbi:hypothetical protein CYMTET_3585 [Cymbomonas tetramitiformis]|uniref:Uncharacterized protein n=1 Tax=Cymbomonas tetramitiformis TaxID=36881 RepID=A0AAE0H3C2_9CHLO|nr:hypothetical protein CYMTET_3585 [Cymbomonas tetramitiformis]
MTWTFCRELVESKDRLEVQLDASELFLQQQVMVSAEQQKRARDQWKSEMEQLESDLVERESQFWEAEMESALEEQKLQLEAEYRETLKQALGQAALQIAQAAPVAPSLAQLDAGAEAAESQSCLQSEAPELDEPFCDDNSEASENGEEASGQARRARLLMRWNTTMNSTKLALAESQISLLEQQNEQLQEGSEMVRKSSNAQLRWTSAKHKAESFSSRQRWAEHTKDLVESKNRLLQQLDASDMFLQTQALATSDQRHKWESEIEEMQSDLVRKEAEFWEAELEAALEKQKAQLEEAAAMATVAALEQQQKRLAEEQELLVQGEPQQMQNGMVEMKWYTAKLKAAMQASRTKWAENTQELVATRDRLLEQLDASEMFLQQEVMSSAQKQKQVTDSFNHERQEMIAGLHEWEEEVTKQVLDEQQEQLAACAAKEMAEALQRQQQELQSHAEETMQAALAEQRQQLDLAAAHQQQELALEHEQNQSQLSHERAKLMLKLQEKEQELVQEVQSSTALSSKLERMKLEVEAITADLDESEDRVRELESEAYTEHGEASNSGPSLPPARRCCAHLLQKDLMSTAQTLEAELQDFEDEAGMELGSLTTENVRSLFTLKSQVSELEQDYEAKNMARPPGQEHDGIEELYLKIQELKHKLASLEEGYLPSKHIEGLHVESFVPDGTEVTRPRRDSRNGRQDCNETVAGENTNGTMSDMKELTVAKKLIRLKASSDYIRADRHGRKKLVLKCLETMRADGGESHDMGGKGKSLKRMSSISAADSQGLGPIKERAHKRQSSIG